MLVGTADIAELARTAPVMTEYYADGILFDHVTCFQMTLEMRNGARQAVLPPALHPTIPAALSLQAWKVRGSPWGNFDMVVNRISCRSGVRARGFTRQVICSSAEVANAMASTFGYPTTVGEIKFSNSYSGVDLKVILNERLSLAVIATDPDPMGPNDVQYTSTLNLAHTPNGLRMVQLEEDRQASKVDRLKARLNSFQPDCWGSELFDPYLVASASVCEEQITMKPIRFVCLPDQLAFTGTEPARNGT